MNTITYQQFIIQAPTLNIHRCFDDKESALVFVNQLMVDFPNVPIERMTKRETIAIWDEKGDDECKIQTFEAQADIMAVNRRVALASLTTDPSKIMADPFHEQIVGSIACCIAYYGELLDMLHTAKARLEMGDDVCKP